MKNKILGMIAILSYMTTLHAGESNHYLSIMGGGLNFDRTVKKTENGIEKEYTKVAVTGINYTFLKEIGDSPIVLGVRPQILFDDRDIHEDGFINVSFLAGTKVEDFSIYGNYGVGLSSIISRGKTYGVTARYDFTENFSAAVTYTVYKMDGLDSIFTDANEYKAKGTIANLSLKF
jgi:hypothetical protein